VREGIENGVVTELQGYQKITGEVPYGEERSRIDLLLSGHATEADCYVEIKNVSLGVGNGQGLFPDAVTLRGQKHLRELLQIRAQGYRALLFFCVQHRGVDEVGLADSIDPDYGNLLRAVAGQGVELLAYRAALSAERISLCSGLPVNLLRVDQQS
jgi:sugar fermentation stimulation protein A